MEEDRVTVIAHLEPEKKVAVGYRAPLSRDEGREILKAFRRGVSLTRLGAVLGLSPSAVHSKIGTWAMKYACIEEHPE